MATEIVKLGGIDLFYVCVFSFSHVFEVPLYVTLGAYIQFGDSSPEMQTECDLAGEPGCHLCGSPCLCLSNLVSLQHVQISTREHTTVSIVIRHIGAPILWHSVPTGSYGEVSLATVAAATVPITAFRSQMQMRGQRQYRTPFTRT
ncbi:hypothetical protein PO909_001662 [Leuciscus waleckii]